jgi:hypothetical protein
VVEVSGGEVAADGKRGVEGTMVAGGNVYEVPSARFPRLLVYALPVNAGQFGRGRV